MNFTGQGLPITASGFASVRSKLQVNDATIWAIVKVETRGFGFLADRRPQILFERHWFSRLTQGEHDAEAPSVSNRTPGGYTSSKEYERLTMAMELDEDAALQSASWGLGQVMGFNYQKANYTSVQAFVKAMVGGEDAQLRAVGDFIIGDATMHRALINKDWKGFASLYNGPSYAKNQYDTKLAQAYSAAQHPDIPLRAAQAALTYLGYEPGPVDGLSGKKTTAALTAYQTANHLAPTGRLDDGTNKHLRAAAFGAAAAPQAPARVRWFPSFHRRG